MEWLTWLFLEARWALLIVLGLVNFGLLVHWRRGGRPLPLLLGLGIACGLLIVEQAIVTPREHAAAALSRIERDLLADETDDLAALLAPDFEAYGRDRAGFLAFVADRQDVIDIVTLRQLNLTLESRADDQFVVRAVYLANVRSRDFATNLSSSWRVTFGRTADGWRIATVEAIQPSWGQIRQAR